MDVQGKFRKPGVVPTVRILLVLDLGGGEMCIESPGPDVARDLDTGPRGASRMHILSFATGEFSSAKPVV